MTVPRIGVLGLGEAGASIADGLVAAGAAQVRCYDAVLHDAGRAPGVRQRAHDAGVVLADDLPALLAGSELVLSLVTSAVALEVAHAAAPHLRSGQVYVDLNSAEPRQMEAVAEVLAPSGAAFADGAIMAAVPPHGHRVPMLLSGSGAAQAAAWLSGLGGDVEVLSHVPGAASATKLTRSLVIKGLEALLWESAMIADLYGEAARVLSSLAATLPGEQWYDFAGYLMGRTVRHGERRAHEMDGVAAMLEHAGITPHMAAAAGARLRAVVASFDAGQEPEGDSLDARALARGARGGAAPEP